MTNLTQQLIDEGVREFEKKFPYIMGDIGEIYNEKLKPFLSSQIQHACEQTRKDLLERVEDYILGNHDYGAIPTTDEYANGWNDSRKRSYQQVKYLIESLKHVADSLPKVEGGGNK